MNKFNVLLFPAGSHIANEIWYSLKDYHMVKLFAVNSDVSSHAKYLFENIRNISDVYSDTWIDEINNAISDWNITHIIPCNDICLMSLVNNLDKINAKIVTSPLETCTITRSKKKTYDRFNGIIPIPEIYNERHPFFPLFLKPDDSSGGKGTQIVNNEDEFGRYYRRDEHKLILEYLPGDEYTIDCFSDREKGLLFAQGRKRVRVSSGLSVNSIPIKNDEFTRLANKISSELPFYGAWFFQMKEDRIGNLVLMEIAPRIAAAMATSRVYGVNFPLLSLFECERIPYKIMTNDVEVVMDKAFVNRYSHNIEYNSVYVDMDDTLIIDGKVSTDLVKFIFQCRNKGKNVYLITRNISDVRTYLKGYHLDIFVDIIKVKNKASFLRYEKNSILIDNSFSEREEVSQFIKTFDLSMLELLMDDRV